MQIWRPSLGCHFRCGEISNGCRSMERPLVSIISRTQLIKASASHKIIKPEIAASPMVVEALVSSMHFHIVHGNCINIDMPGWCWSSSQLESKRVTLCCNAQIAPWFQHKQTTPPSHTPWMHYLSHWLLGKMIRQDLMPMKSINENRTDWDLKVNSSLRLYRTSSKRRKSLTPPSVALWLSIIS